MFVLEIEILRNTRLPLIEINVSQTTQSSTLAKTIAKVVLVMCEKGERCSEKIAPFDQKPGE